jgi:hypothetical protein
MCESARFSDEFRRAVGDASPFEAFDENVAGSLR